MCRRPCRQVLGRGASIALLFALAMVFAPASGAYAASKRGADTTVTITAFPPSIQVDATDNASTDRPSTDNADTPASDARGARHPRTRIQIDDEEFDSVSGAMEKAPWVIGLIFLSVLLLFLTPVVLVVGIIWYKLRKARLQNEAMLALAEKGVIPPAQAAEALASGVAPEVTSAAPSVATGVSLRKRAVWSDLRKGIIMTMIGLALCFYSMVEDGSANWVGLVLVFLGVGYIALWWMEGRHLDRLSRSIGKSDVGTS